MPIRHKVEAVKFVLQVHPVFQSAKVIAEMQWSGGLHPAQNTFFTHRVTLQKSGKAIIYNTCKQRECFLGQKLYHKLNR